ncbi:MAG TPA: putative Ig domain-containing protein, partial [Ferruginibacter sp.]|nr:putative Ig domain-containing protein [Ferruginibacter sp.]
MKKCLHFSLSLALYCLLYSNANAQCTPVAVTKTNSTKVYVHYMPWFFAPRNPGNATGFGNGNATGQWGNHWRTNGSGGDPNTFTNVTDYTGATVSVRNIDAHSHPLIGPYDGSDPNVMEYHLLLMKLSGIDGVMIDWYGLNGNGAADAGANQVNSSAVISSVGTYELKYGLIVEDGSMSNLPANLSYASSNYFTDANYIKLGDMRGSGAPNAGAPLVGEFEPYSGNANNAGDWSNLSNNKAFLPLYGQAYNSVPSIAGGTFMWPDPQAGATGSPPSWYTNTSNYYSGNATTIHNSSQENGVTLNDNVVLGTAYQGFFDFYLSNASSFTNPNAIAGQNVDDQYGIIPRNYGASGNTLTTMLNLAQANKGVIDGIQIATWNDFSEGTIIEPTVEYGFQSLVAVQQFTGVPYTEKDLRYVDTLFMLRQQYSTNSSIQTALNQASCDLAQLNTGAGESLISCIYATGTTSCASGPVMSNASTSVTVENPLSYQIVASASNGAITGYGATGLPTGLIVNTSTGVISGTPVNVGVYSITMSATNSHSTSTATLTLTVNQPSTEQPYLNTIATIPGVIQAENYDYGGQGVAYSDFDVTNNGLAYRPGEGVDIETNTDGASPSYDVGWTNAGEWMKYTVNVTAAGTYTMTGRVGTGGGTATTIFHVMLGAQNLGTIHVPNTGGWTVFQTSANVTTPALTTGQQTLEIFEDSGNYNINYLTFTLNAAAPVVTSNTATATVGTAFTYTISATNAPTGYTATPLPAGLSFNTTTGVLSGTPTTVGTTTVNISATNSSGTGNGTAVITVNPAKPVITSNTATGTVGTAFSYTITATNSPASYTASPIPGGLSFNTTTGVLSGTPSTAATTTISISATNAGGTGNGTVVITINPAVPVVTSNTATGTVGTAFSYTITATNNPTSYTASPIPGGLLFNTTTGVLSGTPTTVGTTTISISATNAGGTGNGTVVVMINPAKPVITSNTATGTVGTAFSYTITATNNPTSYTATPIPGGLSFNTTTGVLSGTPTTVATTTVSISATNGGGTGNGTVVVTINPAVPVVTSNTATGTVGTAFSYTITATNSPTSYTASPIPGGLS